MTPAQLSALRAYIDTVPAWSALPNDSESALIIAAALNEPATPEFVVWRTQLFQDTITQNGFDWTQVDNLTVGKARIWEWMFLNATRSINPSKPNVRAGIVECWSGTTARVAVQTAVLGHCKRTATVAEKVLATGTGTTASPATMGHEGAVSYADVQSARSV